MALDPSIALNVKPVQIESPLDTYAKVAQFKQMQQQNRLADLMFGEKQREAEQENALARLYSESVGVDGKTDRPKLLSRAAQSGLGAKIPALQKTFAEQDKAEAETYKIKYEAVSKADGFRRDLLSNVNDPQAAAQWMQATYADPLLGPIFSQTRPLEQALAAIPSDPAAFADWKRQSALGAAKFIEQNKPKIETRNLGGTTETMAINPFDGSVKVTNSAVNTQSPDNKATVSASYANAAANREIAAATRDAAKITAESKRVQDTELKLQDDYRTESKGFSETSTAMKKVLGSIDVADKNPGAALAAGTAFMKLLDPNSVVRESELGMALNASGWFDRAMNIANTLQAGKVMTPKQKENLRKASETLFEEAKAAQREIDAAYEQRARAYGLEPTRIIVDRGQKTAGKPAASGGLSQDEQKELEQLRQRFGKK